jgi:hypothetical protein
MRMRLATEGSGRGRGTRDAVGYNGQRTADEIGRDRRRGDKT